MLKVLLLCSTIGMGLGNLVLRGQTTTGGFGRSEWRRTLTSKHNPSGYRRLHTSKVLPDWTYKPNDQCQTEPCSEQVHISPGAGEGEMTIQWTSFREEGKTKENSKYKATVKHVKQNVCAGASTKSGFEKCSTKTGSGDIDTYTSDDMGKGDDGNVYSGDQSGLGYADSGRGYWNTYHSKARPVDSTMRTMGHQWAWWTKEEVQKGFSAFTHEIPEGDKYEEFRWKDLKDPNLIYTSPYLYKVHLKGLESNTAYYYMVDGDDRVHSFTTLPGAGKRSSRNNANAKLEGEPALTIGLIADSGQTIVAKRNYEALTKMNADLVLHAGDLSYAEGVPVRWDSFGRMIEDLSKTTPTLYVPGNHDISHWSGDAKAYVKRYDLPYADPALAQKGVGPKGPSSDTYDKGKYIKGPGQYWSVDSGLAHIIGLNSYDAECYYPHGEGNWDFCKQTKWLKKDLAKVDRNKTPWVVVMMHTPFYNSAAHYMMNKNARDMNAKEKKHDEDWNSANSWWWMKKALEPILNDYGVDFVFNGHVHTYERMHPVSDWKADKCGPTYVTMGDGGNYESVVDGWVNDKTGKQPEWSAYREGSFGVGSLQIMDDKTAQFEWKRTACSTNNDKGPFESPMKGFKVDLNPECSIERRRSDSDVQNNIGSDSDVLESKKSLGCPLKPQPKKKTAAPALGSSGSDAAASPTAAVAQPTEECDSKCIALSVALAVALALLGAATYYAMSKGKPDDAKRPIGHDQTEKALGR